MGAINYATSEYITLAVKPYDIDDYLNDQNTMEIIQLWGTDMADVEAVKECAYELMQEDYSMLSSEVESIIEEYELEYYKLTIEGGYYEGFSINIECCLPSHFYDYIEKKDAQKEVTRLKKCLIRLVNECCLVECFPHWCTGYSDKKETIESINNAIKLMRKEIEITETERQVVKRLGIGAL